MFMEMAKVAARRGTCDRARVGAVLVNNNNKVVSVGYNGAPHGEPHCDKVGHLMFNGHCIRTIHAEENCLDGVTLCGHYTLYVTHYPCAKCQITIFEKLKEDGATMEIIYSDDYGKHTHFEGLKEIYPSLQFTSLQDADGVI
jgi:dCMP deaminase